MHRRVPSRALAPVLASLLTATLGLSLLSGAAAPGTPGSSGSGDSLLPAMGNGGYDVRDYSIKLRWKPSSREIAATTRIRAVATQHLSRFNLELSGLRVRQVTVAGAPARVRRDGVELMVTPADTLREGQRFTTVVVYDGRPRPNRSKQLGKTGWLSTPDGATALSEPTGSETWYPVNNALQDKATYTISVNVPKKLKAASNGRLVGRKDKGNRTVWRWREDKPMAPYLTTVSIGRYRMYTRTTPTGLPLISFIDVREGKHKRARRVLPEVLDFLEKRFGRYPFTTSGLIVDRINVGYALETQGRPVLTGSAPDYLVVHELAHQWFGNSVTPADWRHIWLNEGMATYIEWLWEDHRTKRPGDAQEIFDFYYDVYGPKARFWKLSPGDPGSADRLFARQVYDRGAMTMHALRLEVGSKDFFTIMRRWATENRHGSVTTADFVRLAERVSGKDLDDLFQAWLYTPEKPRGY